MIPLTAINGALRRITHQPSLHGVGLYLSGDMQSRIKRGFCLPVGDQLNADKQAASTDITNMRMLAKRRVQPGAQAGSFIHHPGT